MRNNVKIFVPVILAIIIGSLTFAFSQTGNPNAGKSHSNNNAGAPPNGRDGFHPGGFPPHILDQLNLTDAQKQQIAALETAAQTASQTYFDQIRTADDQLHALITAGTFDEAQARQILNTKAQASVELELIHLRTDAAIYNLLTTEQKTLLTQLLQQRPDFPPRGH